MVNVDTKLLVIFTELLSKRNATYVAEKMHMTAPAVSHSLGRLREIFDDPLFIRVPHGLTPTPRALELGPKIRDMLDLWSSINEGDADNFDPAIATGTLSIGFAAELGDTVFNRFVLRIKQLAALRGGACRLIVWVCGDSLFWCNCRTATVHVPAA